MWHVSNRAVAIGFALLTLTACSRSALEAPRAESTADRQRISRLGPADARSALVAALRATGFAVEVTGGGVTATSSDPRYAHCDTIWVVDRSKESGSRGHFARADSTTANVRISLTPTAEGTAVDWRTRRHGSYLNRFNNWRFEASCRGTGAIDDVIEAALAS